MWCSKWNNIGVNIKEVVLEFHEKTPVHHTDQEDLVIKKIFYFKHLGSFTKADGTSNKKIKELVSLRFATTICIHADEKWALIVSPFYGEEY